MWSEVVTGPWAVGGMARWRGDSRAGSVFQCVPLIQGLKRWECELGIKIATFKSLENPMVSRKVGAQDFVKVET